LRLREEAASGAREGVAEAVDRRVTRSMIRDSGKEILRFLGETKIRECLLLGILAGPRLPLVPPPPTVPDAHSPRASENLQVLAEPSP